MSTSLIPGRAKRLLANATRLGRVAQGLLPRNASLAVVGGIAAFTLAAGPQYAKDSSFNGHVASDGLVGSSISVSSLFASSSPKAPFNGLTLVAAQPFHDKRGAIDRNRAAECLAAAAWYEAGNDPVGQRAVIQTVVNRVNNASFPNTFCGVVFEGSELPTGCQFTFTCDGSLERRRPSPSAWKSALALSQQALAGFVEKNVGTATHYHAAYVNPWWSGKLERLSMVGPHIFYRWPGGKGTLSGQRRLGTEGIYDELRERSLAETAALENATVVPGIMPVDKGPVYELSAHANPPKSPQSSAIFLTVEQGEPSGRWAMAAMKACKGQSDCQVLGYAGKEQMLRNQAGAPAERSRPIFLFIRDAASAMSLALWDCEKVDRPSAKECLPADKSALANLLRERH
ncbi:cell wall hydrolase [Altererythrobacter sp. BO-6]|uniref:cell wall hydrolase n=1 Tax=Altererythrobacter sp. BO-6 TaxID=2604537 RepID=UPI0013E0EF46|nr:cell wall hydrolase [Altererythrobacter sp. BO-6]QIG53183.1 cell wall hydrolase [Altererythrobacter sp. BO-6]